MISPEQLAAALERLDPEDRELLALSLRRRVPDDALARLFNTDAAEVARRRAAAIERLADRLGVQRGTELGAVLRALLEDDVWGADAGPPVPGSEFEPRAPLAAVPPAARPPDPVRLPVREAEGSAARAPAPDPVPAAEPELALLPGRGDTPAGGRGFPRLALALFAIGLAALVGAAGLVGATQFSDDGDAAPVPSDGDDGTRYFVPRETGPVAAPFPSEPQSTECWSTASVRRATTLHRKPGGKALVRVTAKTEWSSPRVFGVVRRRDGWLAVQAPELRNGQVGWLPARRAAVDCTTWSLHADLSRRRVEVRRAGKTLRAMTVAVGRDGNSTPTGRFSVTDKLLVRDPASVYGCCVLALTGHQTALPAGWPGGDRLAVHATRDASSIGQAASLGCLRAPPRQARWLVEKVPLGAPIFIRA